MNVGAFRSYKCKLYIQKNRTSGIDGLQKIWVLETLHLNDRNLGNVELKMIEVLEMLSSK